MRALLDTNIFLEVLLDQEKSQDVRKLLSTGTKHDFFITDFSLHSVGILLFRTKRVDVFAKFAADVIERGGIEVLTIPIGEIARISENAKRFKLDFDDAYQYSIAERHDLTMVSFDTDLDRTERKRKTPLELL